jgi:MoaA/NifB/PqqE/SkfB family radical SAM enzyme
MKDLQHDSQALLLQSKYNKFILSSITDKFTSNENNKNLISIITINNCNLNCSFCRGSIKDIAEYSKFKVMSTLEFKSIVDKCLDSGIKYFDLTPAIGEPFLDKEIITKFQILEEDERVLEYTITSNILLVNERDILKLSRFKKLIFDISLYGETIEEYQCNTNRDSYLRFLNQLEMVYSNCDNLKLRFIQRCTLTQSSMLNNYINTFRLNRNANLVVNETYNVNRAGHISTTSPLRKRSGICPYGPGSGGGIVAGGNVLFCPFHDLKRSGVMGNINHNSLSEIYNGTQWQTLIDKHTNNQYEGMCKGCDETW